MIKTMWTKLVRTTESYLGASARACRYCGLDANRNTGSGLGLCRRCHDRVPWIDAIRCLRCGRPDSCPDCERHSHSALYASRSAVRYDERMKEWLAAYKYRGNERLHDLFADMLHRAYKRHEADYTREGPIHWITFVPVSERKLEERGFNQAAQLAGSWGRLTGIPVVPLLRRNRDTVKQSSKNRMERLRDLEGAFSVDEDGLNRILKKSGHLPINIVIVDDVYTTGSTLNHCAQTIRDHMDANVFGLTWAR
ncbi:ComF family protein [Paenibacillus flagellatus]|uniref:Competence protein ComFC n=1 Tax=Paenibacillus flagellatus TaxID=2211139 RepID=A0A2V5JY18_9BACL|nr:ComF family protein [Paenibacillus flagellatus]PYI51172.1 competence protein ComFC [Paenibacillus flagellatus]